jgi:hypothetical protein
MLFMQRRGCLISTTVRGCSTHLRCPYLQYLLVNMLIFLAPVSAFDQTLAEDPSVNRLWDSFLIWRSVCSSKLLRNVAFILLLNKYDLLDAKLKSGIRFASHVTSYKTRGNDTESVLHCAYPLVALSQ